MSAPPRRPPSTALADGLAAAHTTLLLHRLDPGTGRCTCCGSCCPCRAASEAAALLAAAGLWSVTRVPGPLPVSAPPDRARGWHRRVARALEQVRPFPGQRRRDPR